MPKEEKSQNLGLLERLKKLKSGFKEAKQKAVKLPKYDGPIKGPVCCVVCKGVRLDNDPTGVTCGSEQCLKYIGDIFQNADALEKRKQEADEMEGILEDVANLFGANMSRAKSISKMRDLFEGVIFNVNTRKEKIVTLLGINDPAGIETLPSFLELFEKRLVELSEIVSDLENKKPIATQ